MLSFTTFDWWSRRRPHAVTLHLSRGGVGKPRGQEAGQEGFTDAGGTGGPNRRSAERTRRWTYLRGTRLALRDAFNLYKILREQRAESRARSVRLPIAVSLRPAVLRAQRIL